MESNSSAQTRPLDLLQIDNFHSDFRLIGVDHAAGEDVTLWVTIDAATRRVVKIETRA